MAFNTRFVLCLISHSLVISVHISFHISFPHISLCFLIFPLLPCLQNYLRTPLFLLAHCEYMWTQKNAGVAFVWPPFNLVPCQCFCNMVYQSEPEWVFSLKPWKNALLLRKRTRKRSQNIQKCFCWEMSTPAHQGDHAPGPWSVPSASQGSPWQVGEKLSEPNNRSETNRNESFKFRWMVPHGSLRFPKTKKTKKLRFWKWTIQTSALRALTPSFNLKSKEAWAYPVYHSFTDLRCVNMCVSIFSCHKCFRLGGKAAATDWSSCGLPAQCVVGKNKNAISGKQLRVLNGTE